MDPVGYDMILANVAKVDVNGAQVQVTWKCPVTGKVVGEFHCEHVRRPFRDGKGFRERQVQRRIRTRLWRRADHRQPIGWAAGRVVSNAAYTAAGDINSRVTAGVDYTEDSRQAAIVAAFETMKPLSSGTRCGPRRAVSRW
jgi:hypothetical protein